MTTMSLELYTILLLSNIFQFCLSQTSNNFNYIGQFKTENPSFVELLDLSSSNSFNAFDLDLVVTNFAETGTNGVSSFNNIGLYLKNISNGIGPPKTILADKTLTWPNFVYIADSNIFPAETTLIIHDGFLTPFHGNGGVYALLINNSLPIGSVIRLEPKKGECYYHNSTMIDIDGDGLKDILMGQTCKEFGENKGSLIWLKQPKSDVTKPESWIKTELIDGPDILITTQIINETTIIVYAAQFFTSSLKYYYLRIGVNSPYIINNDGILIDDTIGAVYDVQIVDIFKNGRQQLLVNDHEADGSINGVFLYEFPDKFPNGNNLTFIKHKIAGNFNTTGGVGVGAPGFCTVFDLNVKNDINKPFKIGVAGDGNFITWQLSVINEETFTYSKDIIQTIGGTAGIMAFGDVDGDGYTEVFIPYYEDGIIYVYTANPNTDKYN